MRGRGCVLRREIEFGSGDMAEASGEHVDADMSDDLRDIVMVEQGSQRLLQHPPFVAHDDLRRAQFDQPFQAVVAVDRSPIELLSVRSYETGAADVGCVSSGAASKPVVGHRLAPFRLWGQRRSAASD